jgi:hypothetical protein
VTSVLWMLAGMGIGLVLGVVLGGLALALCAAAARSDDYTNGLVAGYDQGTADAYTAGWQDALDTAEGTPVADGLAAYLARGAR